MFLNIQLIFQLFNSILLNHTQNLCIVLIGVALCVDESEESGVGAVSIHSCDDDDVGAVISDGAGAAY